MRRMLLCLSMIGPIYAVAAEPAPTVCNDGKCIQVGSYNIELLGSDRSDFDGMARGYRTDDDIAALTKRIAVTLDLEVLVLQEINTASLDWKKLKESLRSHGYAFMEGRSSDRDQFVVVAWDAEEVNVVEGTTQELDVRDAFDLGPDCSETGLRRPVAARLRAGDFDFWVVGVHLKSRVGEEDCTTRIRREQCKDLTAATNKLIENSGEKDVLIVGDFNHQIEHESLEPLAAAGFMSQMKFLMPGSGNGSFIKNAKLHESTDLIDHVLLRYANTKEVVGHSGCVMLVKSKEAAKDYILTQSDHVPVWASFRTDKDLDGPE